MAVVFDIETNGFLDVVNHVHSLCAYDICTDTMHSFADQEGYRSIDEGLEFLQSADLLVGHNILCYDIPVLEKLYPGFKRPAARDTLTMSRLIYTDMFQEDMKSSKKGLLFANKCAGRHSLKAWGLRLGDYKQDFECDWATVEWSKEMQEYCEQDVEVQTTLYKFFLEKKYSEQAIELEHKFQEIIFQQEMNGVPFDKEKANAMYYKLKAETDELTTLIQDQVPPVITVTPFTPKRDNAAKGYVKGEVFMKRSSKPFNPGSRNQIANYLMATHKWTPVDYTDKGNIKMSSEVLENLPYPETELFSKYLDASKVKGRLVNQKGGGWLSECKDGRIKGRMITNGAITGRATHMVISNIPRITSYMGKECRALFTSGEGIMVGCDASQLELRMLAHYMARYDRGKYTKVILEDDVHEVNRKAAGLPTRDLAKTFIYALLYGAGDQKIGSIVDPAGDKYSQIREGKRLKEGFFQNTPAYLSLLRDVKSAARKGHLIGLDGRLLKVRGDHMALNTLLQGAGAVVMKQATVNMWASFKANSYIGRVYQAINYHDENQVICEEQLEAAVGVLMVESIKVVAPHFNLRCPLDAEYKIGQNWSVTH